MYFKVQIHEHFQFQPLSFTHTQIPASSRILLKRLYSHLSPIWQTFSHLGKVFVNLLQRSWSIYITLADPPGKLSSLRRVREAQRGLFGNLDCSCTSNSSGWVLQLLVWRLPIDYG